MGHIVCPAYFLDIAFLVKQLEFRNYFPNLIVVGVVLQILLSSMLGTVLEGKIACMHPHFPY
jgi:hypothetical protein